MIKHVDLVILLVIILGCLAVSAIAETSPGAGEPVSEEAGTKAGLSHSQTPHKAEPVLLNLRFSQSPVAIGQGRVITSRSDDLPVLQVINGGTVTFSRKQQRTDTVYTWYAGVPGRSDHWTVRVTPRLIDGRIELQLEYRVSESGNQVNLVSTLTGRPGEWISLIGAADDRGSAQASRSYHARSADDQLAIRVDLAP